MSGTIVAVQFSLQSDEDRRRQARANVSSCELFSGEAPVPGGVYDPRMGTTDVRHRCVTCGEGRRRCPGHPGVVELRAPLLLPMGLDEIRRWLRVVCHECGAPVVSPSRPAVQALPPAGRLAKAAVSTSDTVRSCPACRASHPRVVKSKEDKCAFFTASPTGLQTRMLPAEIGRILSRISNETCRAFGRDPQRAHPRNLVIHALPVAPVTVRPGVRMQASGNSPTSYHDINALYQNLIKANNSLPAEMPEAALRAGEEEKLMIKYDAMQMVLFNLLLGEGVADSKKRALTMGGRQIEAFIRRLVSKHGRFRKNLLGKRVFRLARNTISGNNSLALSEIGIPQAVARDLQVEETVQPYNLAELTPFFLNGRRQYPGATRVRRAATGQVHDVEGLRQDFRLELGDVLYRDLVDGDYVVFNRQPSLERSSLGVHRVVVLRSRESRPGRAGVTEPAVPWTFQMNVLACEWYNADFDGDEMTAIPLAKAAARAEGVAIARVERAFISTKSSGPVNGQIQDSTIGSFLLTRSRTRLDKVHAMELFANMPEGVEAPDFSAWAPADQLTGRDVVSLLLAQAPVSLSRAPSWFSEAAAPFLNYEADETRTVIEKGQLLSGVLDSRAVGAGASGGVFHRIMREYGSARALEMVFAYQQMAVAFLDRAGLTISTSDLVLPRAALAEVHDILAVMMRESQEIAGRLERGEIVPPLGLTVRAAYELQQIQALKRPDTVLGPIYRHINPDTNGLFQMIATGSKGKIPNLINIAAEVGQITLNGKRLAAGPQGRGLAYFPRGALGPAANGFIAACYVNGLSGAQHMQGAQAARLDLTFKGLATASTGYLNRKSIMSLQSLVADSLRRVASNRDVVQFLYGEDGLDARQLEPVTLAALMASDKEVAALALGDETETAALAAVRTAARAAFLKIEQTSLGHVLSDRVLAPVNAAALAAAVIPGPRQESPPEAAHQEALAAMRAQVDTFCSNLPYLYLNRRCQAAAVPVPAPLAAATTLLELQLRAELGSAALHRLGATPATLKLCLDRIWFQLQRALVAPGEAVGVLASQSVSEPLTQYMLDSHHRSVSGGSNKSGVIRPDEIFAAKPVEKEGSPEMLLRPAGPDGPLSDEESAARLAEAVKMLTFEQLLSSWQILCEDFPREGSAMYPGGAEDRAWIGEFLKFNPLLPPPADLASWCLRFEVRREALVLKQVELRHAVLRLRDLFPALYFVHSPETGEKICVRAYPRAAAFKRGAEQLAPVEALRRALMAARLRGIGGVADARVKKIVRHRPGAGGALVRENDVYVVMTSGTNLAGALAHPQVDSPTVVTSSIGDTISVFGIEAGRARILHAIRDVMQGNTPNMRHLHIYADQMTRTGRYTSLEIRGLKTREGDNPLLRAANAAPAAAVSDAAFGGIRNPVYGAAAALAVGAMPHVGTYFTQLDVDSEFVAAHVKTLVQELDDLEF